eukprot:m51a1_g4239 putative orn arg lys decarboxylase (925) ;mRNA; f:152568-156430
MDDHARKMTVILITKTLEGNGATERGLRFVIEELAKARGPRSACVGVSTLHSPTWNDGLMELKTHTDVGAVLVDWDWELNEQLIQEEDLSQLLVNDSFSLSGLHLLTTHITHRKKAKRYQALTTVKGKAVRELEREGINIVTPEASPDILAKVQEFSELEDLLVFVKKNKMRLLSSPLFLLQRIKARNVKLPIFILTDKLAVEMIPLDILEMVRGYIWMGEDTPSFIANRILQTARDYFSEILPPFFKELLKYSSTSKYAWHTPGHMGGVAFLRSPAGKMFLDFYGENSFRSDLSVSVPELGSLLDHSSVVGMAEANAARVFGAEETFFITNGTSTSNKIVFQSVVVPRDIVLLDRNSHKSSMQAIQLSNAYPIYLRPVRNEFGILGPVPLAELDPVEIVRKISNCKFIPDAIKANPTIKLMILTNSTYDGLCYNVPAILEKISKWPPPLRSVQNVLFDEAWSAYAHFHPLYHAWHAMSSDSAIQPTTTPAPSPVPLTPDAPGQQFAVSPEKTPEPVSFQRTMSPSILQINHSRPPVERDTPSPSLVHQAQPQALAVGQAPLQPSPIKPGVLNAVSMGSQPFQPTMTIFATQSTHKVLAAFSQASMLHVRNIREPFFHQQLNNAFMMNTSTSPQYNLIASLDVATAMMDLSGEALVGDAFKESISFRKKMTRIHAELDVRAGEWWYKIWQPRDILKQRAKDPMFWVLPESGPKSWHGFPNIPPKTYMLDPLKVTIVTRNLGKEINIPACVMARYLGKRGVVIEKTDFFTLLILFTIGVTRGKSGTLLSELQSFKKVYDQNLPKLGIRELCNRMIPYLVEAEQLEAQLVNLPDAPMTPGDAYCKFVERQIEWLPVTSVEGRISATLLVPYPPGIPMVMPGEVFNTVHVKLLTVYTNFWATFPGFETEVHGLCNRGGKYYCPCIKQ